MRTVPSRVGERLKSGIKAFHSVVESARSRDVNESDTVIIVTDMLSLVFGYDKYSEITSEFCIRGTYCDLATKLNGKIQALIEVKAAGSELKDAHARQVVDYAAKAGVEWVVLTNAVKWRVYKVLFNKPIDFELVLEFDLVELNPKKDEDIERLFLLAKEGWDKSALEEFDTQRQALNRFGLAAVLISDPILKLVRRQLKSISPDVRVEVEEIRNVLLLEVLKRDVLEGERAEEAQKKITRAENRARKARKAADTSAPTTPTLQIASSEQAQTPIKSSDTNTPIPS
jgi:hypothetical protein